MIICFQNKFNFVVKSDSIFLIIFTGFIYFIYTALYSLTYIIYIYILYHIYIILHSVLVPVPTVTTLLETGERPTFTTPQETLVPTTTGNSGNRWSLCSASPASPISLYLYFQAKEQERSSQEPAASKRKVVSVRKLVKKQPQPPTQPQQSRFANFRVTGPAAPAAPARQPEIFQSRVRPGGQSLARHHVRQQQPEQPAAPAYTTDPRFTGEIDLFLKYFLSSSLS